MTDVKLVKDCGLYPSYKKIIDFTGTKSEIIQKQLAWINTFENDTFLDVNYNKFQNKLTLPIDYTEALGYTYCVLTNITGTDDKPQFFFINDVANLTNGIEDAEPNVSFDLSLDPIMTFMGEWKLDECYINREHVDRWNEESKPIRITPNEEGVTAFARLLKESIIKEQYNGNDIVYICIAFTSDKLYTPLHYASDTVNPIDSLYYGVFPIYTDLSKMSEPIYGIYGSADVKFTDADSEYKLYVAPFPTLEEVINGVFMDSFDVTPEDIVSISILPNIAWNLNIHSLSQNMSVEVETFTGSKTVSLPITRTTVPISVSEAVYIGSNPCFNTDYDIFIPTSTNNIEGKKYQTLIGSVTYSFRLILAFKAEELIEATEYLSVDITVPTKPTDGVNSSSDYEPALFMAPYMKRYLVDGKGQPYLDIPDYQIFENEENGVLNVGFRQLLDGSNSSSLYFIGENISASGVEGSSCIIPNETLYVVNDQWKTYNLTRKDSDRQMVINYAIKNAVDNLIYMSYGGALVGSRSAGEEGYLANGYGGYSKVKYYDGGGTGAYASERGRTIYPHGQTPGSLTATGRRVVGAIGLAAGASIFTSLVDAHTAWANQLETEKQIQNKPAGLLQGGTGQSLIPDNLSNIRLVETKVDDIAFDRAYNNFRKYGYFINKFEKPNIQSRKYFNYILTNGAIVNGAINQSIRDVIASIFDAGVTIFHYDSGDTTTRNLEYTDKENIEVSLINNRTKYYTVKNVLSNHTIHAEFEDNPKTKNYTISNVQDNHNIHAEFELE